MNPISMPTRMAAWLESAWLARYLDRDLSDDEAAWFEGYLLDKQELLGLVEADNELRDAVAAPAFNRLQSVEISNERTTSVENTSVRSASKRPSPWWARAASIVLGMGIGWLGPQFFAPKIESGKLIANPTRMIFDTIRGGSEAPQIEHAETPSSNLFVEIAVPSNAENIVFRASGQIDRTLLTSPDGFVSFLIPRSVALSLKNPRIEFEIDKQQGSRDLDFNAIRR